MIRDKLFARPLALEVPMGAEDRFAGVIDLVRMKSIVWTDQAGERFEEKEIPPEYADIAAGYRERLIDALSEGNDEIMEAFLEGAELDESLVRKAIRELTLSLDFFPVFCGSALKNRGVQPLLDAIVDYLPSPRDIKPVEGHNPKKLEQVESREASDKEPFSALVFKIMSDPYVGRLSYMRVYSGHIRTGDAALNVTDGRKERIGRILRMHANDREEVSEVYTGDIVALVGLKSARTGDTLCDEKSPILLEKMEFPEPVISIAIEPRSKADQDKMNAALHRLEDEDPTFRVKVDEDTGQNLISGMGELHLEIIIDRLTNEFNVSANIGKPQVAYKETITRRVEMENRYERQIGAKNQFGHVVLVLEPAKPGSGILFENRLQAGVIPEAFVPVIESGVRDAMEAGVLAGYRMVDVKVALVGSSYNEADSVDVAYRIAATVAVKDGARKAEPTLLEPIMKLEVVVPEEYMGDIINDINSRRGKIDGIGMQGQLRVIDAHVPLSEVFGYATGMRSLSQGRASHTLQFSHYDQVPRSITETIVARLTGRLY